MLDRGEGGSERGVPATSQASERKTVFALALVSQGGTLQGFPFIENHIGPSLPASQEIPDSLKLSALLAWAQQKPSSPKEACTCHFCLPRSIRHSAWSWPKKFEGTCLVRLEHCQNKAYLRTRGPLLKRKIPIVTPTTVVPGEKSLDVVTLVENLVALRVAVEEDLVVLGGGRRNKHHGWANIARLGPCHHPQTLSPMAGLKIELNWSAA